MASFHRKLLPNEAQKTNTTTSTSTGTTSTTVKTCLFFCSSQSNQTTPTFVCPEACLAICPSVCHYALEAFILPPEPSPPPNNPQNLSPLLISMLIILGSALFLITFYVLYTKLYSHFYNYQNSQTRYRRRTNTNNDSLDEEHGPTVVFHPIWYIPTVGLNPSVINSITVCKYGRREKDGVHVEGSDCAVCLAEFQQGDELRVLPKCNHAFHIPCIDTWLRSHTNCPLCRAPVVVVPRDPTAQNSSPVMTSASGAGTEDHSPAGGEELRNSNLMRRSASTDCVENKVAPVKKGSGGGGSWGGCSSQSQRWSNLERGAASLVSRSLSCSAKIFSSRYNHNHNNNSSNNNNNNNNNDDDDNNKDNDERPGPNS